MILQQTIPDILFFYQYFPPSQTPIITFPTMLYQCNCVPESEFSFFYNLSSHSKVLEYMGKWGPLHKGLPPVNMASYTAPAGIQHTSITLSYIHLFIQISGNMQQKGTCKQNSNGVQYQKTAQDERLKVITLHDNAGWNWVKIS